jgi:hypothetical protein
VTAADSPPAPARAWLLAGLRALGRRRSVPSPPPDLDWRATSAAADAEDLLPALAHLAAALPDSVVPAAARARLIGEARAARARHLVMTTELGRLLRGCRAAGLPVIVLKGPALAETVYPEPALRPFSDLDLLVRPADRLAMDALLRDLGLRRLADEHTWEFDIAWDGATLYEAPAGVRVDLHWSLLTEPRFAWSPGEQADVWGRAVPLTVAGERGLQLGREDLVLHLATHLAVHHSLASTLRYWDVALVLERAGADLDWEALLARAARWRVQRALFFVLRGAHARFDAPVPPAVLAALRPRGPRAVALAGLLRAVAPARLERLEYLVTLLLADRGRDLAGALRQALWPPADWMQARYGLDTGSRPALYVTHVRRLGACLRWGSRNGPPTVRAKGTTPPSDSPGNNRGAPAEPGRPSIPR